MSAASDRMAMAKKVGELRKLYPFAIAHADHTEVIAPRELPNLIRHMLTGEVLEPIFVHSPGKRTLVVPKRSGGVEYVTTQMV